ncbi:hypothetical protein [Mycolicibacterium wolinskyi]|uniref:hypothetical protein n=1 Tax=Mycolicibacterium wolinskyi TaxID=59750 RepID=UPI0039179C9D
MAESNVSKEKQPSKSTTKATKRPVGRPKKSATTTPPKRAAKARIVTVTDEGVKVTGKINKPMLDLAAVNDRPVAKADTKPTIAKPVKFKKTVIDPRPLQEAYKEAIAAAKKYEDEYTRLKIEVASVKSELDKTKRTVAKLKELIAELQPTEVKAVRRSVWPWRNR